MNGEALLNHVNCLSCTNGSEENLISKLLQLLPQGTVAISPVIERTEKHNRQWVVFTVKLTPGYVFVFSETAVQWDLIRVNVNFNRVLAYSDRNEQGNESSFDLRGGDLDFAKWIYYNKGRIEVSKAISINKKVVIIDGPLVQYNGRTIRIDKHNRKALVSICFCNVEKKVWLSFDWLKEDQ